MSPLDAALAIVAQGFPAFPCRGDKRPATEHGFHDATTDESELRSLFRHQGAELAGCPTGETAGFDVLDLDYRHGAQGWELANAHRIPETRVHRTLSGGRHYLFRHAPGVRNSASRVGQGIDVRGDGGYVIMPPSPGYSIDSDAEITEWPDWLLALVLPPPTPPRINGHAHAAGEIDSRRLDGFVKSITDRLARAPEGGKHFALRNAALSLGGIQDAAGLSDDRAIEMLLSALPATVRDWKGAAKTASWGLERGRAKPIELEDRHPHQPEPPPVPTSDPGWWTSLEARLADDGEPEIGLPRTSAELPQDADPGLDSRVINPTTDWTAPAPLREWIIDGWIPRGYVTGIYGDGGVGKSLLAQQLLTSVALGLPWLGLSVVAGRAFGMMCEDDRGELHRRQEAINAGCQVEMRHLELLRLAPRLGCDNLLMTFDQFNHPHLTELFSDLCRYLDSFTPTLVVLDTLADIFGGNEISRVHARSFVQGVGGRIARRWNCGVVIAAHPSSAGIAQGTGTSGNTAWNNTFRSRIYVTRPENDESGDSRLVSRMKSNYAPRGGEINCRWEHGAFVTGSRPIPTGSRLEWHQITAIFDEITRAWDAGDPWSNAPQTRKDGRYLPLWAQIRLGAPEKLVAKQVNLWLADGYLKVVIAAPRNGTKGLRVERRPQPPVGSGSLAEVEE